MEYMVVYSTKTENTKKLAFEIFKALPGISKDMQNIKDYSMKPADTYFVGFWTNRGCCDMSVIDLLSELHGKRIALFGTCAMGNDDDYYKTIIQKVSVFIPDDNEYLGSFMCQGKMPMTVRERYEMILRSGTDEKQMKKMLQDFDEALFHPNQTDYDKAAEFVDDILKKINIVQNVN